MAIHSSNNTLICIQCTSDIMATLGHPFVATISICHFIWPEYTKILVFCTRKSGHFIQKATINVANIFGVHCSMNIRTQRRQFKGQNTPLVYCTDLAPYWRGQCNRPPRTHLYRFIQLAIFSHHGNFIPMNSLTHAGY